MSSTCAQSHHCSATPILSFFRYYILFRLLPSSVATFIYSKDCWGNNIGVAEWTDIHGIHHWKILRSSYRKLTWMECELRTAEFHSDALTDWAIRSWIQLAQSQLCATTAISSFFQYHISFQLLPLWVATFISSKYYWGYHMSVVEWTDIHGIHHSAILRSSYRKLVWVGFKPTTTEFRSESLTNWAIRPKVQVSYIYRERVYI